MRVPVVDLSECIRCGVCEAVCPGVFKMSEAGFIQVAVLPEYPEPQIQEAIRNCPARCIEWQEQ